MEPEKHIAEDVHKIHAEINQIVNQRFLLLVASISLFGVALGWLVSRPTPAPGNQLGAIFYLIPTIYSVMLTQEKGQVFQYHK